MNPLSLMKPSWAAAMEGIVSSQPYRDIGRFIKAAIADGQAIEPSRPRDWLRVFCELEVHEVRVCLIGPEPYATRGISNGLAFAVNDWTPVPPMLHNVFREVERSMLCGLLDRSRGDLSGWTEQGVMLLNARLTTGVNAPGSHDKAGWQVMANQAIKVLDQQKKPVVFIDWSGDPLVKIQEINRNFHLVLSCVPPSPRNIPKFLGNGQFVVANDFLQLRLNENPIDWSRTTSMSGEEF